MHLRLTSTRQIHTPVLQARCILGQTSSTALWVEDECKTGWNSGVLRPPDWNQGSLRRGQNAKWKNRPGVYPPGATRPFRSSRPTPLNGNSISSFAAIRPKECAAQIPIVRLGALSTIATLTSKTCRSSRSMCQSRCHSLFDSTGCASWRFFRSYVVESPRRIRPGRQAS